MGGPRSFLPSLLVFFFSISSFSKIVSLKKLPTHTRLKIQSSKDAVLVDKKNKAILIQSLDQNILDGIYNDLAAMPLDKKIIKSVTYSKDDKNYDQSHVKINLVTSKVEMFTYYDYLENKLTLDLWSNVSDELKRRKKT